MKTYYGSFVPCKSNRNTYITLHTVMKSLYTNVKYHCETSWYFSVHCLSQSLRNYKEEANIKSSEKALAMPGQPGLEKDCGWSVLICGHAHRVKKWRIVGKILTWRTVVLNLMYVHTCMWIQLPQIIIGSIHLFSYTWDGWGGFANGGGHVHSGETDEANFIRYGRRRSDRIGTARFLW